METGNKEKILVIQTGGTIDKCYPRAIGGYAFEFGDSYCQQLLSRLYADYQSRFSFCSAFAKDSQEISDDDRLLIVEAIKASGCTRILVTHGTDTMIETAKFLQRQLDMSAAPACVVVLTGARLPGAFKDTDADLNLGFALGCLAGVGAQQPGVYVCMSLTLMRPGEAVRDSCTGAFAQAS